MCGHYRNCAVVKWNRFPSGGFLPAKLCRDIWFGYERRISIDTLLSAGMESKGEINLERKVATLEFGD